MRFFGLIVCAAVIAGTAGCGGSGPRYVPVSGVVTLDGKPYGEAVVTFQPKASASDPAPGRGSAGYTDENGKFVLKTDDLKGGAVVGKHHLRIATKGPDMTQVDPSTGSPDNAVVTRGKLDPIPAEWNTMSTKEFEVPAGGTDKANFDITGRKK